MTERIHSRSSVVVNGKFVDHPGTVVGKVTPEGKVEGTDYAFKRSIRGGVAITQNNVTVKQGKDLVNPATHERFKPTRKGTGFWSALTHTLIKPFLTEKDEPEE
jgi:hypothetical protein